ncbi:MAG: nitroreductase family protein, partial [Pseudomonadota bacterium]
MRDHETVPYTLEPLPEDQSIARAEALRDRLKERRTCRYFSDAPVPRAVIEAAIEAAGTAPNGANHQPWHFAVVESIEKKKAIREAAEAEEKRFYGEDGEDPKASDEWLGALKDLGTDADKPFLETAPYLIAIFMQKFAVDDDGNKTKHYYPLPRGLGRGPSPCRVRPPLLPPRAARGAGVQRCVRSAAQT